MKDRRIIDAEFVEVKRKGPLIRWYRLYEVICAILIPILCVICAVSYVLYKLHITH